jgi:hypothetical protein
VTIRCIVTSSKNLQWKPSPADHKRCDDFFAQAETAVAATLWTNAEQAMGAFSEALELHFSMEAQVLFPEFEEAVGSREGPTAVMRMEHRQMREILSMLPARHAGIGIPVGLPLPVQGRPASAAVVLCLVPVRPFEAGMDSTPCRTDAGRDPPGPHRSRCCSGTRRVSRSRFCLVSFPALAATDRPARVLGTARLGRPPGCRDRLSGRPDVSGHAGLSAMGDTRVRMVALRAALPDQDAERQFRLHLLALVLLVLGTVFPAWFSQISAIAFTASSAWLWQNLLKAARLYRDMTSGPSTLRAAA